MADKIDENGLKWYVLRAFSGKEKKVKEHFEAEIKNGNFGKNLSDVVLPIETVTQLRNGKKVVKEHILTPGYVLVKANLVDDVAFRIINAPNVMGFLSDDQKTHKPTPIHEKEALRMMNPLSEIEDNARAEMASFNIGDKVKIVEGALAGGVGEVVEVFPETLKLRVEVSIFGRKTPLDVDFMQVEKDNGEQ